MPAIPTPAFDELEAMLNEVSAVVTKSASLPPADEGTSPSTGARAAENSNDLKEVPGGGIESDPAAASGSKGGPVPLGAGLQQGDAAEMHGVEKAVKTIECHTKQSHDLSKADDLAAAKAGIIKVAAELAKMVAEAAEPNKTEAGGQPAAKQAAAQAPTAYDALAARYGATVKQAEEAVLQHVAEWEKYAADRATLLDAYVRGFNGMADWLVKQAAEGGLQEEMGRAEGGEEGEEGEGRKEESSGEGGGGGGEGGAPEGAGPSDDQMGDLAGGMMDTGHTPQSFEQQLMALIAALQAQQGQGGPAGGPPGGGDPAAGGGDPMAAMGGGMPPEAAKAAADRAVKMHKYAQGIQVARAVRRFTESGRFQYGEPKSAASQAQRQKARQWVSELLNA